MHKVHCSGIRLRMPMLKKIDDRCRKKCLLCKMDLALSVELANMLLSKKREGYTNESEPILVIPLAVRVCGWILSVLITVTAVYLSWTCNTAYGRSLPVKIAYATLAFFFGLLYLIFYVLFSARGCRIAKNNVRR